jgi:hypothetical protein
MSAAVNKITRVFRMGRVIRSLVISALSVISIDVRGQEAGFAISGRLGGMRFSVAGGQSSTQSLSSVSPSLTMISGYPATLFSGTVQPFVVGVIPIVGDGYTLASPQVSPVRQLVDTYGVDGILAELNRRRTDERGIEKPARTRTSARRPKSEHSTAARGDISVAEIRSRARATNQDLERQSAVRPSSRQRPLLKLEEIPKRSAR